MIEPLLRTAIDAAITGGQLALGYHGGQLHVTLKADQSPLTQADLASHHEITDRLRAAQPNVPILSEEGDNHAPGPRRTWSRYWLVDPLDGTKEFVRGDGDFTVNVALMAGAVPIAGVVYAPVSDLLFYGEIVYGEHADGPPGASRSARGERRRGNAWLLEQAAARGFEHARAQRLPIEPRANPRQLVVASSRSHGSPQAQRFVELMAAHAEQVSTRQRGSALKLCMVAEGTADFYPRYGPTMEWDTAAGDAILRAAGGQLIQARTGRPLRYNKHRLLNPYFIAVAPGRQLPAGLITTLRG